MLHAFLPSLLKIHKLFGSLTCLFKQSNDVPLHTLCHWQLIVAKHVHWQCCEGISVYILEQSEAPDKLCTLKACKDRAQIDLKVPSTNMQDHIAFKPQQKQEIVKMRAHFLQQKACHDAQSNMICRQIQQVRPPS